MRKWILPLISLSWLVFVLVLYYSGHKPAEAAQLLALLMAGWHILSAGLLVALAGGLGAWLWPGAGFHALARLSLQAGLGLGLLGLGVLGVGISVGLPAWLPWAALVVLLGLLRKSVAAWLRNWRGLKDLWGESGRFGRCLALLLGLIFLIGLWQALAPPIQYDSLTDHFALPTAYLRDGRISYYPWLVFSGMPQNAEMLYTWAIGLGGYESAAGMCWSFGLLSVLGLMGVLRQVLDERAAWVGAAALLVGSTPVWLLSSGYIDGLAFLLSLGALALLAAWRSTGERRSLVFCGLMIGLAVGTKYTSAFLALAAAAALAWHAWKRREALLPAGLMLSLTALAAAGPWFLKNWLTTSNPFYPFFMTGGAMTEVRLQVYQHLPPWGNGLDLLFLPVRATYLGFDASDGYMFAPGMLLLGLGALAWLELIKDGDDRDASLQAEESSSDPTPRPTFQGGAEKAALDGASLLSTAGTIAVIGLILWALGNQYSGNLIQTRYYFSIFPAFAILSAFGDAGLRRLRLSSVRLGRVAAAVILIALVFNTLEVSLVGLRGGALETVLGLKSSEDYLAGSLGWFEPAMKAVLNLPEGSRAQLIYEPRWLYCTPRCLPDDLLDRWKRILISHGEDGAAIRLDFQQEGISHLLVNQAGVNFLMNNPDPHHPQNELQALERFLQTLPAPVDFGGVYQLYSLQ